MAECLFIKADEVVKMLGVSQSEAYRIIKKLNEEMAAKGYGNCSQSIKKGTFLMD